MGMYLELVTVSDANIKRMLADSALARKPRRASLPVGLPLTTAKGNTLDLDKAWNGIHYLLTGSGSPGSGPLNFLLAGGSEVTGVDHGYGPPRVLSSRETKAVHAELSSLSNEQLAARFNPGDMLAQHIYPEIWNRPAEEDDSLGYLLEHLELLRDFLAKTAADNVGLLIILA